MNVPSDELTARLTCALATDSAPAQTDLMGVKQLNIVIVTRSNETIFVNSAKL
jgi:hypothetical protein